MSVDRSGPLRPIAGAELPEDRRAVPGSSADRADDTVIAPAPPSLAALRGQASRGDYSSMCRLARALYDTGLGPREVLAECFGVTFPEEFFLLADESPDEVTLGDETNLPWQLAVPPDLGGPVVPPWSWMWEAERGIFVWDPDLVPLLVLESDSRADLGAKQPQPPVRHGDLLHCYRLSELVAGRSTVFGVPWSMSVGVVDVHVRSCGESLLTVLHEHASDCLALDRWELRQPWNWGAGSTSSRDVAESREHVAGLESLQRRLGES